MLQPVFASTQSFIAFDRRQLKRSRLAKMTSACALVVPRAEAVCSIQRLTAAARTRHPPRLPGRVAGRTPLQEAESGNNSTGLPSITSKACNLGAGGASHSCDWGCAGANSAITQGEFMKKMMRSLMATCFLAVSLSALAQSGDAMKQDSMKQDDSMKQGDSMKKDGMKKDDMKKDKKSKKKAKKDDSTKKDDSMKQN
jgi:pentapeptide MXKDX repeat protein